MSPNLLGGGLTNEQAAPTLRSMRPSIDSLPAPEMSPGQRLKWVREQALRVTQQQLADKVGVARANLAMWETDQYRPSLENAVALEALTGIPPRAWLELPDETAVSPAPAAEVGHG